MENGKLPTTSSPMKREPSGRGAAGGRRDSATERRPTEFFRQSRHHLGFAGEVGCSRWRRSGERFVDSLGQRSSSGLYEPNYDPDDGLSNTDSCDESIASSDEECASKKKKALEDALFGFFRMEAIKSLKRDFSKFCMNFDLKTEQNKRQKVMGAGRDVFSVFSTKYFADILRRMASGRKDVILKYGFECLLKFEKTDTPSRFVRWIVGCVDTVSSQIIVADEKIIPITKDSIHFVLGLPNSGALATQDKESGKNFIMSHFRLTEMPNITFFGDMLTSSDFLSEEDTFICFMVIAMSCFLFPSSSDQIHTEYLSLLEDPKRTSGFDFCALVYYWTLTGINKYVISGRETGRKPKVFDFCSYCLAVLYLDRLDFGVRAVEQGAPRILAWKGNTIKHFSELDHKRNNLYGRRPFKKQAVHPTFFGVPNHDLQQRAATFPFKQIMHSTFDDLLPAEIIDGIINIAHSVSTHNSGFENYQEAIISNVLKFLSEARATTVLKGGSCNISSKAEAPSKQSDGVATQIEKKVENGSSIIGQTLYNLKEKEADLNARTNFVSKPIATELLKTPSLQNNESHQRSLAPPNSLRDPATPECVITKIVEPNEPTAPEMEALRKVKARVCNISHSEQELSLLNTFPAGAKDRSSFFQYSVRQTQGTFMPSTVRTNDKPDVGAPVCPFQSEKSKYIMINNMSPINRINLSQHFSEKDHTISTSVKHSASVGKVTSKRNSTMGSQQVPIPVGDFSPQPHLPVRSQQDIMEISPRSFGVRQSQLAKNADALYNAMLAPAMKHEHQVGASSKVIPNLSEKRTDHIIIDDTEGGYVINNNAKDDLVILKEKQILSLPKRENNRFPVTDDDCRNYNTIIELAFTKGMQKKYALLFPRVHCNFISLGQSLMPEGHIDNFLVPCICRKFFEDCHPTISGRHHFFPHIGETILKYNHSEQQHLKIIATSFLGAASASRKKRLDCSDRLFFPLCHSGHWIVFAVDFKYSLFAFLDSFYDMDSQFHLEIRDQMIDNFIKLWEIVFRTNEHNFRSFNKMYPYVPKQGNEHDCGVFAVKGMEIWEPAMDLRTKFSASDILHIRIQYMNQLYFWRKNDADKTLVTNCHLQGNFV